jgi:quercetin dioxygenase-like cupin family protein
MQPEARHARCTRHGRMALAVPDIVRQCSRAGIIAWVTDLPGFTAEVLARHAERPGFRITELRMSAEQCVPWHSHSNTTDTFYVLEGRVRISLRDPDEQVELGAGDSWGPVPVGRPHRVTTASDAQATFLDLQGIGEWDFVPLR